jgi:CTP:molybdopterin cytidylyltransferase MocA
MPVAAVVLAAGASTRYGRPKQRELLPRVLARLAAAPVDWIVVVEGAHRLRLELRSLGAAVASSKAPRASELSSSLSVVRCEDWERGPGASLRTGLATLGDDVTHAVVVLADGPALDPRAVERLLLHGDDGPVLAASYDGTRDHPVLLARAAWDTVPDAGGRALEALLVDCSDLEPPGDVDYNEGF